MHTLTLHFPTMAELHTAVTHLLKVGIVPGAAQPSVAVAQAAPAKATTGKPKPPAPAEAPAPAAAASASAPAASAPAASAPKADAAVDYPTLQKAVFKLAGVPEKGRAAATELLAKFNVATFKELAEERWAEALAAVESKIKELA